MNFKVARGTVSVLSRQVMGRPHRFERANAMILSVTLET